MQSVSPRQAHIFGLGKHDGARATDYYSPIPGTVRILTCGERCKVIVERGTHPASYIFPELATYF
jgi:hypothetical protein